MSSFVLTYRNDHLVKVSQSVLLIVAIVLLLCAGYLFARGLNAERWPDVKARIVELKHIPASGGKYVAGLVLEYEVDQKPHGVLTQLSTYSRQYLSVSKILERYKVGSFLTIKLNPSDPSDCMYGSKIYYDAALVLVPAATCLVLIWVLHLFSRLPVVPDEA